jgi:hypothetical protein
VGRIDPRVGSGRVASFTNSGGSMGQFFLFRFFQIGLLSSKLSAVTDNVATHRGQFDRGNLEGTLAQHILGRRGEVCSMNAPLLSLLIACCRITVMLRLTLA